MKRYRPSLQIYILALFLVFLLASAGTMTWFNYRENRRAAMETARDLLVEVNERVLDRIVSLSDETFTFTREAVHWQQFVRKQELMREDVPEYLAAALSGRPQFYSAFIGYNDGNFCQVVSLRQARLNPFNPITAPDEARLAVRKVYLSRENGVRVESWVYVDGNGAVVGSRKPRASDYDPRTRSWYDRAVQADGPTHTGYYFFDTTGTFGVSVAHRFSGSTPGVFGVEITLDDLCDYFARQRIGKRGVVFMFEPGGRLNVHPDKTKVVLRDVNVGGLAFRVGTLENSGDPLLLAVDEVRKAGDIEGLDSLIVEGERYLVRVSRIDDARVGNQYIAVAVPVSDFTRNLDRTRLISLLFAGGIGLLAVGMAFYFSRVVSGPLRQLAVEAEEIRRFNLDSPVTVSSSIAEVFDLTRAIATMKSSLGTFGRYVPKALVRQLLLKHVDSELGGERRELTLLFSDIANFTTIAEDMAPEALMLDLSEYLQVIGAEIQGLNGTIDKYMGDAVMAFWNAPNRQEEHVSLACEAVLKARQANRLLNEAREARELPPLDTRFGLHTGEVVIGNLGTEDRMDYTAVGATVNLASRLEGLNKFYATSILVSETVRRRAGERFLFRSVGKVLPKGTTTAVRVYELLGTDPEDLGSGTAAPEWVAGHLSLWEEACAAYRDKRFGEAAELFTTFLASVPDNGLGEVMVEKARRYITSPPEAGWDGVDLFDLK